VENKKLRQQEKPNQVGRLKPKATINYRGSKLIAFTCRERKENQSKTVANDLFFTSEFTISYTHINQSS